MGALQLSAEAIPLRKRSASWLDFARFRQDFSWVSKDSPARSTCISADPCRFQAQILKIYGLQHTDFNQIHRTIPFDFQQFPCVCTTRSIGSYCDFADCLCSQCFAEYQEAVQEAEFLAERRHQEQQAKRSRTQERSSSSSSSTFAHQPNRHRGVVMEKKTVKGAGGSKVEWCCIGTLTRRLENRSWSSVRILLSRTRAPM